MAVYQQGIAKLEMGDTAEGSRLLKVAAKMSPSLEYHFLLRWCGVQRRKHQPQGRWKSRAVPSFGASAGNPGAKKSFSENGSIICNGLRWEFYPDKNYSHLHIGNKMYQNVIFKYYSHLLKSFRLWIHVAISSGEVSTKIAPNCVYVRGTIIELYLLKYQYPKKKERQKKEGKNREKKEKEMKRKK